MSFNGELGGAIMEYWTLSSQGDPLGNLRKLVKHVWLETDLKGMLITANNGESKTRAMPRFITDVELIDQLNPFTPLMEVNIARLIPGILADNPGTRIGALLRPCEMRALIEMTKHTPLNLENLLTISVDCLGTLPADEYQWRLERLEKSHSTPTDKPIATDDELAHEALAFARQGGIIPYRYRSACQVCTSPAANQAEININVLGLPIRQQMLLSFNAPGTAEAYHLDKLITGVADKSLVSQHERILSKMCERHANTMERVNEVWATCSLQTWMRSSTSWKAAEIARSVWMCVQSAPLIALTVMRKVITGVKTSCVGWFHALVVACASSLALITFLLLRFSPISATG